MKTALFVTIVLLGRLASAIGQECQFGHKWVFDTELETCKQLSEFKCAITDNKFINEDHCKKACIKSSPRLEMCNVDIDGAVSDCYQYYCDTLTNTCRKCESHLSHEFYVFDSVKGFSSKDACENNCPPHHTEFCQFAYKYVFVNGKCTELKDYECANGTNAFFNLKHCKKACLDSNPKSHQCNGSYDSITCLKHYCDYDQCKLCPKHLYMIEDEGYPSKEQCNDDCKSK